MCAITKAPETIGKVETTDGVMKVCNVEATDSVGGSGDIRSFIKKTRRRCGSPKKFVQLPLGSYTTTQHIGSVGFAMLIGTYSGVCAFLR